MRSFLHACIHCTVQQHILYLCASFGDTVNDMCIALSNEGVMNRWWCVRLSLSRVLTASEARAVDCKCVHGVVWMMEWTHFMTNWKGKIQQAVTAQGWGSRCSQSTLFFFRSWDWWEHARREGSWSWLLSWVSCSPLSSSFISYFLRSQNLLEIGRASCRERV